RHALVVVGPGPLGQPGLDEERRVVEVAERLVYVEEDRVLGRDVREERIQLGDVRALSDSQGASRLRGGSGRGWSGRLASRRGWGAAGRSRWRRRIRGARAACR